MINNSLFMERKNIIKILTESYEILILRCWIYCPQGSNTDITFQGWYSYRKQKLRKLSTFESNFIRQSPKLIFNKSTSKFRLHLQKQLIFLNCRIFPTKTKTLRLSTNILLTAVVDFTKKYWIHQKILLNAFCIFFTFIS